MTYGKEMMTITFLGKTMELPINSLEDRWSYKLIGRLKEIAVSNGHLPRLPWEITLFGARDPIEGIPRAIELDGSLECISINQVARAELLKYFPDGIGLGSLTFEQCRKVVSAQRNQLCEIDRAFVFEIEFLMTYAEPLAEARIRELCLAALPSTEKPGVEMEDTLSELRQMRKSALVLACANADAELDTMIELVEGLRDGSPPRLPELRSSPSSSAPSWTAALCGAKQRNDCPPLPSGRSFSSGRGCLARSHSNTISTRPSQHRRRPWGTWRSSGASNGCCRQSRLRPQTSG